MTNTYKIIYGDALSEIEKLESESVDCVITSPPYWNLRDYGFESQLGLEESYIHYLEYLWDIMKEVNRILKPTGTVWINLGDTYKNKSLTLIPHRFAIGCIDRGWKLRNDIIWAKPNALPEGVKNRFSKKHEYLFFFVKHDKYYFDLESVRIPCMPLNRWGGAKMKPKNESEWDSGTGQKTYREREVQPNNGMKNPGDVSDFWSIPTKWSKEKHWASYPVELIDIPLIAGCPENGTVLDMFCGSGTTLVRGLEHGRNVIGMDGKKEYCEISEERVEKFLSFSSR